MTPLVDIGVDAHPSLANMPRLKFLKALGSATYPFQDRKRLSRAVYRILIDQFVRVILRVKRVRYQGIQDMPV